jgi:hypothetical protein
MNDHDSLSALLRTWRHTPREEPAFNRGVWARLDAPASSTASAASLAPLLSFPGLAARWAMPLAASVLVLLSLAVGSGAALAFDSLTRAERMAAEYARSIDPLQMAATHSH